MIVLPHKVEAEAKVLIVENNLQHVGWFKEVCRKIGFLIQNIHVGNRVLTAEEEALKLGADVVILDLGVETPNSEILGLEALHKWRGDNAVIVVTHFLHVVEDIAANSQAFAVITKPKNSSDRIRFLEQLNMAIRSALALKSAKGLHRRRSFTEWFRTATSIEDLEIKVTIPFVPWITFTIRITRKMSLFTALSILLAALGVTAFFLLFRRG